ncbi:MAG: hypothetical protein JWO38_676 [Gemmataceae bacterium]|nr:hypothetical protein [Gemmataceae bacterium]
MAATATRPQAVHTSPNGRPVPPSDRLPAAIDHAAHLLPAQGPITVFIHHNTLHAFEDQTFDEAVRHGAEVFGCEPYLTEDRYRDALGRGRIRCSDLRTVLEADLDDEPDQFPMRLGLRIDLRLAMLQYPLPSGSASELSWFVAETDSLRRVRADASAAARAKLISETRRWVMRDLRAWHKPARSSPVWVTELFDKFRENEIETWEEDRWEAFTLEALWRVCRDGVRGVPAGRPPARPAVRHRDLLLRAGGADTDPWVHDVLIRFTAAFLDQGVSHWPLPDRDRGYFHSFCSIYRAAGGPPDGWLRGLAAELGRLQDAGVAPLESVRESLAVLGVGEGELDEFLSHTLLALRGWGGMVREVETRGDRVAHPIPKNSLVEFLAVRLLLERFALAYAARETVGFAGPLAGLRTEMRARVAPPSPAGVEERAFPIFLLAQVLGWAPDDLIHLTPAEWAILVREVEGFDGVGRRRVFHLAYERRFRERVLDALVLHDRRGPDAARPRFQTITCLDEREESFRRHMEEIAPDCETFGAAGFFAVPMYYRGAADAHFVPLCPIVMQPKHWVEEKVDESFGEANRRVQLTRRLLGTAAHRAHVGTRTFAFGALITATLGVLASIPLVFRIWFPRLTGRTRKHIGRFVGTPDKTRLKLERPDPARPPAPDNLGFTLDERADAGERLLRDIGLIRGFSRVVFVLGHGSYSLNNPHKSAYDCGACGGSPGAPNGRAVPEILNDRRVRERLAARGIALPDDTVFVGGFHNTCDDSVTLFDLDKVPNSHRAELEAARRDVEAALDRNAHERCRRFMSAPLTLTPAEARRHVEGRSEDLAQTRPELGHATNAICHVGRRERTRGLYFDRRMFLTSYDPTQDTATGDILARTMAAIFPVCGGINLEYFFSHVDSPGYGCGTKLPHNITSLLGVMDGAMSDLRTGLPWQMTEIHEPVRLLIICETTPEVMARILANNPMGKALTENEWVQLAVQSPETNEILLYQKGEFRPYKPQADRLPAAASSADWYGGWRDHLEFAEIGGEPTSA